MRLNIKVNNNGVVDIEELDLSLLDKEEVVTAQKTFDVTPEITNLPVKNRDAVNKAYIDKVIGAITTTTDTYQGAYGLDWDQTNDTYSRTGADGYTAIQSMMRRCVLHNDASSITKVGDTGLTGTVNYYLHPTNSNFKADGSVAVLDGTDGNVMVQIPKFYYKYNYNTTSGVVHEHSISLTADEGYSVHDAFVVADVEKDYRYFPAYEGYSDGGVLKSVSGVYPTTNKNITTFRNEAEANGAGYRQVDFLLYEAITLLMIIEYGTMNLQQALGQGRTMLRGGSWVGGSYLGITGLSNGLGNGSGNVTYVGDADDAAADGSYMTYRGCENFYGNIWWFADGVLFSNNVPYVNQHPSTYDSTVLGVNDVSTGVTMTASDGYVRELGNSSKGFFPTSVSGGGSSAGTTDYFYANDAGELGIALVGSDADNALGAGPLSLAAHRVASTASVDIGAGVSY